MGCRTMSLQALIDAARTKLTDEERTERLKRMRESMRGIEAEAIARHRCAECGVDTLHYSHTFKCSWRGI